MSGEQIGKVTHYFDHINVAALTLTQTLRVGDSIHFFGHSTDFQQIVGSLQIEHKEVEQAKAGDDVALKVSQRVHPNDRVFKLDKDG